MPRERRSASEIAGKTPTPKWAAMIMIIVALGFIFMVKYGAEQYTGSVMKQLTGDPELELPEGFSTRQKQQLKDGPEMSTREAAKQLDAAIKEETDHALAPPASSEEDPLKLNRSQHVTP